MSPKNPSLEAPSIDQAALASPSQEILTRENSRLQGSASMNELHRRADQLSYYLRELGIEQDDLIAMATDPSSQGERSKMENYLGYFRNLLEGLSQQDDDSGKDAEAAEGGPQQVPSAWNQTERNYPVQLCVHEMFEECVRQTPEAAAVAWGTHSLTYRELNLRANRVAHQLQASGVGPDVIVAVCLDRGPELVLALLAVLKAGGAYLPLDTTHPREHLAYMLADSSPAVLLTERALLDLFSCVQGALPHVLDISEATDNQHYLETDLDKASLGLTSRHLAYVIYTSGSTGQPKGVALEHLGLVNFVCWHRDEFSVGPGKRQSSMAGIAFDATTWEIWSCLCNGATLVLPQAADSADAEALFAWWQNQNLSLTFFTTALAEFAFARGITNPHIEYLLVGGEQLHRLPSHEPGFALYQAYGPTEATVVATAGRIQCSDTVFPIGRPIANARVYILDAALQPLPVGAEGEIYIGGRGVARGYLNRPALTAERFLEDPFTSEEGARMYRTGDLARWLPSGSIEFLGRADFQVKIRGYRIELGEIESQLVRHPEVLEAVVLAREDTLGDKRLVAYYVAGKQVSAQSCEIGAAALPEQLRQHLLQILPEFMVPAAYVQLDKLPLNSNGKVDRPRLPVPDSGAFRSSGYEAPKGNVEEVLASIWAEVLHLETVGREDDFFAMGGHSISVTQLVSKVRARLHVDLSLTSVFQHPTVRQLAGAIEQARPQGQGGIVPVDRTRLGHVPLSHVQEPLWFIHQLAPESRAYNLPLSLGITGPVQVEHVQRALNHVVARHESLRTIFPAREGVPYQQVLQHLEIPVEYVDVFSLEASGVAADPAGHLDQMEAAGPFDLAHGPLLRAGLLRCAEQEHILLLDMHHIISDGWSQGVLIRELGDALDAFRNGHDPALPPLSIQYVDYSVSQRERLERSGVLAEYLAYWKNKLSDAPEVLDLPTDYVRPATQTYAGATHPVVLDEALTEGLRGLAREQGATLFMALLAVANVLFYRYSGQQDICIGTPVANRQQEETHGLIGMFVNTLALRSLVNGERTFGELVSQTKTTCLEAFERQETPFEKVVEILRPERNPAFNPIFQVMLILQNADIGSQDQRLKMNPVAQKITQFDMTFEFSETGRGLGGVIQYSTSLYRPETIERLGAHFVALCQAIVASPATKICDLKYLSAQEEHQLVHSFNNTSACFPHDLCIHDLFAEQVGKNPNKTALVFDGRALTYGELHAQAGDLALYLQSLGVQPDSIVALCLDRSIEMVVSILASQQAGGAYLPLDSGCPDGRLTYMLEDSRAKVVLTQGQFCERLRSLVAEDVEIIALDRQWPVIREISAELRVSGKCLRREVKPHNLSYVIYTSGSTGNPKGVLMEHRALVNRIDWMQKTYALSERDVVLQKTPYSFDVSVWEFFWPLTSSATLVVAAPDGHKDVRYLADIIQTSGVTTLHFVPSMLAAFLDNSQSKCPGVRQIFSSGEALARNSVDRYQQNFPNAGLFNLYGPTEAAIDVTAFDCATGEHSFVPIGSPIQNIQIFILDRHLQVQPVGVPGELYIQGEGLARGYLNRAQLTEEKFIPSPFRAGARLYKTGDLARWHRDGTIEYLGRNDHQIKLRGFRIELGEIETSLRQHPLVRQAAVIAREDSPGDKRLVAYVVLTPEHQNPAPKSWIADLQTHLSAHVPDYMIPSALISLPSLPITSNGKLDRKALPSPGQASPKTENNYEAPSGDLENALAGIWAEVLKIEKVGRSDNFFALGGHSLMTLQLVNKLEREGITISPVDIFKHGSIESLAAKVEFQGRKESSDKAICIRQGGAAQPLFITHDGSGQLIYVPTLAPYIDSEIPIYALPARPVHEPHLLTVEQMAKRMVSMIRAVQPYGPYCVAGWSLGGVPAYEVAVQLAAAGEELAFVGLMDTTYLEGGTNLVDPHHDDFDPKRELLRAIHEIVRYYPGISEDERQQAIDMTSSIAATTDFETFVEKCREMTLIPSRWSDLTPIQLHQTFARIHAYESASVHYRAPKLKKKVHLFRAEESDMELPFRGWNAVLTEEELQIVPIPGTHLSMMTKPNIAVLGQAVTEAYRSLAGADYRKQQVVQPSIESAAFAGSM